MQPKNIFDKIDRAVDPFNDDTACEDIHESVSEIVLSKVHVPIGAAVNGLRVPIVRAVEGVLGIPSR